MSLRFGVNLNNREPLIAPDYDLPMLLELAERVEELGFDSVWVGDSLFSKPRYEPIALLSLGATRRMTLREREGAKRSFDLDLESGSLLTMSHATQFHYDHGIPKSRGEVGPRISLAFRVRPRGRAAGRHYPTKPA